MAQAQEQGVQRFCFLAGHEGVWRLAHEGEGFTWAVLHDVAKPGVWRVLAGRPDQQRYEEDEWGRKDTEFPIVDYRLVPTEEVIPNGYREV